MAPSSSSPSPSSSDDEVTTTGVQQAQQDGSGDGLRRRGGAQKGEGSARRERGGHRGGSKKQGGVTLPKFVTDPDNIVGWTVNGVQDFAVDSIRLVRRCTKPDAREFKKIAYACAVGFLLMGFTGYIVKLIFIPINNIIVGG